MSQFLLNKTKAYSPSIVIYYYKPGIKDVKGPLEIEIEHKDPTKLVNINSHSGEAVVIDAEESGKENMDNKAKEIKYKKLTKRVKIMDIELAAAKIVKVKPVKLKQRKILKEPLNKLPNEDIGTESDAEVTSKVDPECPTRCRQYKSCKAVTEDVQAYQVPPPELQSTN